MSHGHAEYLSYVFDQQTLGATDYAAGLPIPERKDNADLSRIRGWANAWIAEHVDRPLCGHMAQGWPSVSCTVPKGHPLGHHHDNMAWGNTAVFVQD